MAEDTHETPEAAEPTAPDLPGRSRRIPPLLEGEIEASHITEPEIEALTAAEAVSPAATPEPPLEPPLPPNEPRAPLDAPATEPPPPSAAPRPRPALWPVAAGLVLGALIAVGGAFWLARLSAPAGTDSAVTAQLDALQARVATLSRAPAPAAADAQASAKLDGDVTALAGRLDAVEVAAKQAATAADSAQSDAQKALAAATKTAAAGAAAPPVDLGPLTARLSALEKRVAPLEAALAETKTQMRATEDRESAAQQGARAPALAVAAQSLLRTVERGGPFAVQLATVERLGADPARVAVLRPLADKGVPSPAQLAAAFAPVAEAAAKTETPAAAGFFEHIKSSAARLVQIRKIGDSASGADIPVRIEASLQRGDVAAALALWDGLAPPLKAQSEAWAASAKSRLDGLAAAHALETEAVTALAKAKS